MHTEEKDTALIWDTTWAPLRIEDFTDVDKIQDLWTAFHLDILKKEISTLAPNSLFLEAGCGLGQWCFYAAKLGHKAMGVDIASNIIDRLNGFIKGKAEYKNIEFLIDDLMNSKLASNQFDYVVSLGVIEHFRDSLPMLRELHRVLKPGGKIFVSVPNIFALHTITRPLTKLFGIWTIGFEKSYSLKSLVRQMKSAGFKIEESGILCSGQLFGRVLNSLPFFGRFFKKLGYFIETKQRLFGLYIYVICKK